MFLHRFLLAVAAMSTAAAGAVAAGGGRVTSGPRPTGALTGKIVYVHGGHGYTADNQGNGAWTTQRPLLLGMVEDLGNKDQMDFYVDHLFRRGATIAPLRPVGNQENEVVLDNAHTAVTFSGAWQDGLGGVYFGAGPAAGGPPSRFAQTAATATATATYTPDIPAAGLYPVYTWVAAGSNRSPDQQYRVRHAGGETVVTVDHRRVGTGLVYLGSYHFHAGRGGSVTITNASKSPGAVVVADMIRFGNGRGDIDRGGGVSGLKREDEAGLYWIMWHVRQTAGVGPESYRVTDVDRTATISLSPRYAAFMNNEAIGPLSDRVFVSFHSNAGAGKARGVLGLYNGNNYATSQTPNQLLLAETLSRELNDELGSRLGEFEHDWKDRGEDITLDRADIEFGEINNKYIAGEFDATIIETGFHDNREDAQMLRDPRVRDAIAKSCSRGLVKYFHEIDGGQTPLINPPGEVQQAMAQGSVPGAVTLTWKPAPTGPYEGDPATGYYIYTSTDGVAFDAGRRVAGGGTSTHTVAGLDPGRVYYFRVAAANAGGRSRGGEVLAATASPQGQRVLVVDGFDRIDRANNPVEPYRDGGKVERVRLHAGNPRSTAVAAAKALDGATQSITVATCANEAVASGRVSLDQFDAVFWMLGEESGKDRTFDDEEQAAVASYLAGGGRLFVSGSDLAWDLDGLNHGRSFCREVLRAEFASDRADSLHVVGVDDAPYSWLSFSVTGRAGYTIDSMDVLSPAAGGEAVLCFGGDPSAAAAVQYSGQHERVFVTTVPLEAVPEEPAAALIWRVARFFQLTE